MVVYRVGSGFVSGLVLGGVLGGVSAFPSGDGGVCYLHVGGVSLGCRSVCLVLWFLGGGSVLKGCTVCLLGVALVLILLLSVVYHTG